MAGPTIIQIKRSINTGTTPSLANGELAFTANGDILFIGSNAATIPIASKRTPGVLTANQGLVANASSLLDTIKLGNTVANIVISATGILLSNTDGEGNTITLTTPNTTEKGGNYYLKADGSWSTVTGATADPAGTNTMIQYNDSDVMGGSAGFTFDEVANAVTIANTAYLGTGTANISVNTSIIRLSNSTVTFDISKPTAAQVSDGQYYLAADSTWKQVASSGDLDDLTDVVIATPANNQLLVYDNDAAAWENHSVGNGFSFSGQVMAVDGANGIYVDASGIGVTAGTDGGLVSNTTGVWVFANSGLVTNATGLHVGTANGVNVTADAIGVYVGTNGGLTTNSSGLWVDPGTGVVVNSTGVSIGQAVGTTDNVTFANVVTTEMTVSGNLNVTGTLTTVDAVNLVVNDSIIALARNNGADTLDIGLYGQYNDGTERFTGLIWDTTADNWELFANTTVEPTTTLDTGGAGFVRATLSSYLKTGWGSGIFVANSSGVTITANSTWAATITANTLSLSTPLPGTSGGTGIATIANNSILYGNSTNGFAALALGSVGLVLQSNGTALVYDSLDGGTF